MEGFATQDAVRMDITFYVMSQGWYISPLANTQQNILLLGNHHLWHYPSIIRVNLFYLFMSLFKLIHLAHGSEILGSVLDAADVTIGKKNFRPYRASILAVATNGNRLLKESFLA